jgi:hypothetical protein
MEERKESVPFKNFDCAISAKVGRFSGKRLKMRRSNDRPSVNWRCEENQRDKSEKAPFPHIFGIKIRNFFGFGPSSGNGNDPVMIAYNTTPALDQKIIQG